jgi:hypothetical protein
MDALFAREVQFFVRLSGKPCETMNTARPQCFRIINAEGYKAGIGYEQAKRTAFLLTAPFRRAIDSTRARDRVAGDDESDRVRLLNITP